MIIAALLYSFHKIFLNIVVFKQLLELPVDINFEVLNNLKHYRVRKPKVVLENEELAGHALPNCVVGVDEENPLREALK